MGLQGRKLLTYGLTPGGLKHISAVSNGLRCGCTCVHCGHPLVAKNKGRSRAPHFAHQRGTECAHAWESTLHRLAKEVLQKRRVLMLPDFHHDGDPTNTRSLFKKGSLVTFDEVTLEQRVANRLGAFVPDAVGVLKGREIFIEFARTHFVDEAKAKKIRAGGTACIEINVNSAGLNEDAIHALFTAADSAIKYWVHNPKLKGEHREQRKVKRMEKQKRREPIQQQKAEVRKQKLLILQNDLLVARQKMVRYQKNPMHHFLHADANAGVRCPMKQDSLKALKGTAWYQHPIIRRIVDGTPWNGEIYGQSSTAAWIVLEGEKIPVLLQEGDGPNHLFYTGLLQARELLQPVTQDQCAACPFYVDRLTLDAETVQVCRYAPVQEVPGASITDTAPAL